jgi:cell surface protein SprA
MTKFYRYIGLVKNNNRSSDKQSLGTQRNTPTNNKFSFKKTVIDLLTSVKRIQINYSENNGSFLPGYLQTPDFIGSFRPSLGYVFGSQRDIRYLAARNGWLTVFPEFNQQYTEVTNKNLTFSANLTPIRDLKIDLTAGRTYSKNLTENFNTIDLDGDGLSDDYNPLIQNNLGNFNISTVLIKTAFSNSDENSSETFDTFRENRLVIARRLALDAGIDFANPNNFENGDLSGFPLGYGKTNQSVLLPAFLSAYTGNDPSTTSMSAFRNVPFQTGL